MNVAKVKYSLIKSLDRYYSKSSKYKYEKISESMKNFYKEGIKDREKAIEIKNKVLEEYSYIKRSKFSGTNIGFLTTITGVDLAIFGFINFCNKHNKLRKFLNLE